MPHLPQLLQRMGAQRCQEFPEQVTSHTGALTPNVALTKYRSRRLQHMATNSLPLDYNRNLFITFCRAYPEVSSIMFRDVEEAAKYGLKALPNFVATRIGLFL